MQNYIQYGSTQIHFELELAGRKTLGIKVYPNNEVKVIAPLETTLEVVKEKLMKKGAWILKQQEFFMSFRPLTPARKYISGESHLYLGRQYRLKVIESEVEFVKLSAGIILISLSDKSDVKRVKRLIRDWYKTKAEIHFSKIFDENLAKAKSFVEVTPELRFRWMDKRWGSCDPKGLIHLNLELIKAPKKCIEYVIQHEMCHLKHLNHSGAFFELLGKWNPDWKNIKDKLERIMV